MKIVYLFKSLANKGGTERILIGKMNFLAEHSAHEIYVITSEQGSHPYAYPLSPRVNHTDLNCRFFTLKRYSLPRHLAEFIRLSLRYRKALKQKLQQLQPDIVIGTTYSYLDIYLMARLPSRWTTIIESHATRQGIEYRNKHPHPAWLRYLCGRLDTYIFRQMARCSALVVLTQADARAWEEFKTPRVIPNFTSCYPPEIHYSVKSRKIISVGRLENKQKGYDLLVRAWALLASRYPGWTLHLYGSGGDRENLLADIQRHQLQDTMFLHEPTPDIMTEYQESAFYVMSSRTEGFGLVLIEAMGCGLPCVAFDCPHGPADIIRNGKNGFLVAAENVEALARQMACLMENDNLRTQMSQQARQDAGKYLPLQVMQHWEKLFHDLKHIPLKSFPHA